MSDGGGLILAAWKLRFVQFQSWQAVSLLALDLVWSAQNNKEFGNFGRVFGGQQQDDESGKEERKETIYLVAWNAVWIDDLQRKGQCHGESKL